jgi:hypothetical protein
MFFLIGLFLTDGTDGGLIGFILDLIVAEFFDL